MTIIIPNFKEPNILKMILSVQNYFPLAQVVVANDLDGRGKGWALREGLRLAKHKRIVFIDGDLDIHPTEIFKLLPYADKFDIVVGKKELPHGLKRKVVTFFSRLYIRLMFGICCDSQTGLKIFNYKPDFKTDSWACDIEIMYKAIKSGKTIKEVPIHATVSDSKTLKDLWTTLKDSLNIRFRS
jgi:glycosyltransferase involved in cell wall biosynthesis